MIFQDEIDSGSEKKTLWRGSVHTVTCNGHFGSYVWSLSHVTPCTWAQTVKWPLQTFHLNTHVFIHKTHFWLNDTPNPTSKRHMGTFAEMWWRPLQRYGTYLTNGSRKKYLGGSKTILPRSRNGVPVPLWYIMGGRSKKIKYRCADKEQYQGNGLTFSTVKLG